MESELRSRIAELEQKVRELGERQQFLATLDATTRTLTEPQAIMQAIARLLAEHLDVARCAYATVEDERFFEITGDWPRGVHSIVGRWEIARFSPACVAAMAENTPFIVEDAASDARIGPAFQSAYEAAGIQAVICIPLHKQGVLTAAMAVHASQPRRWTPSDIGLVTAVVDRCWETLERAAVAETRVAADRALVQHRARLEYAVRLSGIGFWYCDLPFDELQWDDRVKAHFWLPPSARVTIELFYDRMHSEDRERTRTAIDTAIGGGSSYDVIYRTVDPATAQVKYIRALGGAIYGPDGAPIYFDGVTLDVTELREQDRRKDEFLATLAHELRNPLAPIRTGLELLEKSPSLADAANTVGVMQRQLSHMVRMVDDLLDVSRITLGKVVLLRERVDLRTILDSAIETTRTQLAEHTLELDLPSEAVPVEVDATRIAQVFANLLSNAAKYTPAGGRIRVTMRSGAPVVIQITDTGIGIPPDQLHGVFEMFKQLSRSVDRAQGGLGIGLTLASRLVELHGGTLIAESAGEGTGSTFTLTLPAASSLPATDPVAATSVVHRAARILVVDDNVDAAEMLAAVLEYSGHEVRVANTGEQALACMTQMRPEVVLLDLGLPDLDGCEVARRIRGNHSAPQPLLIALTGWGAEDDRRRTKEAGFDHHLIKPVESARLAALIAGR